MLLFSLNLTQFCISNNYSEQYQNDHERIQMNINILKDKIENDTFQLNRRKDSYDNDSDSDSDDEGGIKNKIYSDKQEEIKDNNYKNTVVNNAHNYYLC